VFFSFHLRLVCLIWHEFRVICHQKPVTAFTMERIADIEVIIARLQARLYFTDCAGSSEAPFEEVDFTAGGLSMQ
jgi:hypothetical protein